MATRISPPQNKTYYINPAYLTFVENSGYGANLIQVSASSSCYISVYDPANGIGYSDADRNYKRWKVTAYNNKFPDNEAWYIYVRLERKSTSALVMYDKVLRGVKGGEITVSKDEQGNDVYTEGESTQDVYWYIKIGDVTATDGTTIRKITYDTGYLESDEGKNSTDPNDMWELIQGTTPWLIRAKHWLTSFTVKGFIKLIGSFIFQNSKGVEKPIVDIKRSIDDDVPVDDDTIPTTAYVRSISDDRYLKKYEEDETNYRIRFYDGIEAGHFVKGMIGGAGTQFDGQGYGEMNGLTLREFLEVPELRFNRIDVVSGELWNSIAFGLVESVDTDKRICRIKLEGKERCGLHVYDICRGIFADFGDGTQWEGVDECGFLHLYGFWTSYFTPTKILENGEGVFSFQYELKAGTTQHPCQSMKFAVYGNFVDSSRQASAYSTRTYKRYLNKVDTWVIDPDKHIYAQYGDLEGLTIGGMHMHGYGSFQSNSYFTGVQIQFTPQQKLELQGESAYTAVLSDYEGVVIIDDEGNVIGGETELLNVISDGMNVITSGENVVTSFYKLRTEVQAMKGSTQLFYSPTTPSKGSYVISLNTVGCSAVVINGVVAVTSVTYTERCYVDIVVNCEGSAVFNLRYHVNTVRDGKNPVIADIDNEMDSVACDSAGKVLFGLPVSCTVSMWAGVKQLSLDRLVLELPDGVSATSDKATGVVTVTDITDEAERALPVNITAYATHGGNQYHKELVFTVNKVNAGENALLYKLSPSASSVKVDDEGNMTAASVSCEVVASDGSKIEPLKTLPEGVTMEYFRDKEAAEDYIYNTPVAINDGNSTVTFRLLVDGNLIDVETIPILLDGSSPVFLDLDNEMFSVACDANGNVTLMPEMVTRATMYWGSKSLGTEVASVESEDGAVTSFSGDTVTVTSIPEGKDTPDTFRIAVSAKATHGNTEYTRTAYLTVNKVRQGDSAWVLDLMPSVSAVKVNNKGMYLPISVSCRTRMTTGKEVSAPAALQDNYTMRYSVDGGSEKSYSYGDEVAVSPEYDKNITALSTDVTFYLYHSEDNGLSKPWVLVDKETVPILMDAADAFKSTVFRRTNETPDRPTGGSYDSPVPDDTTWSDGIPEGEAILWASTRTFTSDGQPPQDDAWSAPAQMTDTASFDVEYSSVESNPGTPESNPSNWSNTASSNTIWMATRSMKNGVWTAWQVSKIKGEKGEFSDLTEEEKDSLKAQYYTIEAAVGSIGYTMTGGYSPGSFIWSEYSIKGSSKTASNVNYARIYGKKGSASRVQLGSRYTNVRNQTFYADSYISYDYDVFIFELEDSSGNLISSTSVSVAKQGASGSMPRYRGKFVSSNTADPYVYNNDYRDIVVHEGKVYMVWAFGSSITREPSSSLTEGNNDGYWEMANKMQFVAMDTALIDNANIAGFAFSVDHYDGDTPIGVLESQNGKLKLDAANGEITALAGNIGGFLIGEYSLVNEGIGVDSYGMSNRVSLTPYDGRSVGHLGDEISAMSGGATSTAVTGFSVGIKSEISSVKDESGVNNSYFATAGGYFEGNATSGNRGAIGVWGKSLYHGGSPYIIAGVVGTEVSAKVSSYTKAQAGVIGFSRFNYGVYAKGGTFDVFLANSSIGNFGLGNVTANSPNSTSSGVGYGFNVFLASGTVTLPPLNTLPAGRMILIINDSESTIRVNPSGTDKIRTTMSDKSSFSDAYTEIYKRNAMFFVSLYPSYSYWYGFKGYDQ